MRLRSASRLSDTVLVLECKQMCADDRGTNAQLLVHIGEIDRRKLHRAAGYSSMHLYCIGELLMSEAIAYRRIRAARCARRFPAILGGIADGRLNLTTVVLLAPRLTPINASELLAEAAHQRKSGILLLLARRFPQPDVPTRIEPANCQKLAPEPVDASLRLEPEVPVSPATSPPEMPVSVPAQPARLAPLTPERFSFQTTIDQETNDLLQRAQELLGHQIAPGDVPSVLKRALTLLVSQLEKQKFAATDKPQSQKPRRGDDPRHVPNAAKREVWERDQGRCTFTSESGHRCEERSGLEFDHIDPAARGGTSTVRNLRLRCRAHNQLEAERVFGAEFMEAKRQAGGYAGP